MKQLSVDPNHLSLSKIIQRMIMLTVHSRENLQRRLYHLTPSKKTIFHWSFWREILKRKN